MNLLTSSFLCPDTFASKVAAIQDQYADASIGNVTGSNAVNVFLGIGVSHPHVWERTCLCRSQCRAFHHEAFDIDVIFSPNKIIHFMIIVEALAATVSK